jgi:tetratricopeptide (TPR) repeat protein
MAEEGKSGTFQQLLKWMGYIAAILSFLGTLYGLGKYAYDRAETNRKVNSLLASESVQLQGRDYDSAWHTLEQAAKLKPDSPKIRAAEHSLVILWLDDIPLQRTQKFSPIVQKLVPVLSRDIASAKPGVEHADLLAHLGWAYYLQFREQTSEVDPTLTFARAVAEDSNNPYAQSMWGYFILWSRRGMDDLREAKKHFASAVDSHRAEDYARLLQTLALADCSADYCQDELLRVASAMRQENRPLPEHAVLELFGHYYFMFGGSSSNPQQFVNVLPPAEHLATFHWLFDNLPLDEGKSRSRAYYLAILQEAAGDREHAIANYRLAIADQRPHSGTMWEAATASIKRLSR